MSPNQSLRAPLDGNTEIVPGKDENPETLPTSERNPKASRFVFRSPEVLPALEKSTYGGLRPFQCWPRILRDRDSTRDRARPCALHPAPGNHLWRTRRQRPRTQIQSPSIQKCPPCWLRSGKHGQLWSSVLTHGSLHHSAEPHRPKQRGLGALQASSGPFSGSPDMLTG